MSVGRMLEDEIARTDALQRRLDAVEAELAVLRAKRIACPFCNPVMNPWAHAAEPMVPNGEYREIKLGGSFDGDRDEPSR